MVSRYLRSQIRRHQRGPASRAQAGAGRGRATLPTNICAALVVCLRALSRTHPAPRPRPAWLRAYVGNIHRCYYYPDEHSLLMEQLQCRLDYPEPCDYRSIPRPKLQPARRSRYVHLHVQRLDNNSCSARYCIC